MVRSREQGRVIPGWQRGRLRPFRGIFLLDTEHLHELHRYGKVGRILMLDQKAQAPPPLWDAQPIKMCVDFWSYSGIERIEDSLGGYTDHAQTWVLVPARETLNGYHGSERL